MDTKFQSHPFDQLLTRLAPLFNTPPEHALLSEMLKALDARYILAQKIAREPGVADILFQMTGRLAAAFGKLSNLSGLKILDIACGSNTSRAPAAVHVNTPFGNLVLGHPPKGYTALFEPWFCRMLLELGAAPVGVDMGDLESESFSHHYANLGQPGALDFLPDHSFDALQDSRLFGSPEFTAQFPRGADRLQVAREIRRQERRLLKPDGVIIHSDARNLVEGGT
jgi:hypothetical protein